MEYSWLELHWWPALLVALGALVVTLGITWLIIFTAVRAALRSWSDEQYEYKRGGKFGDQLR